MAGADASFHEHATAGGSRGETGYTRRRPELSVLYRVVRDNLETFLADARERLGTGYPRFVEREFRRYLECGILAHG